MMRRIAIVLVGSVLLTSGGVIGAEPASPSADVTATAPAETAGVAGAGRVAGSARASKLIGSTVYRGDSAVGRIEDVLVDLDHAGVAAVILSVGGFLGIGDKLVAVPPAQIKVGSEARFTTDLSKEQLTSAPAFDLATLR